MIHSNKFSVVLDACVLYPAPIRDLLLTLAANRLFKVNWSPLIQDEWVRNLLKNRKDLKRSQLNNTVEAMETAFPDANTIGFEEFIPIIMLPDLDDRHVLACAIKCKADLIVTSNIRDFPKREMNKYEKSVQTPDDFIFDIINLDPEGACKSLDQIIARLNNPPKTKAEVLQSLEKCGLKKSVAQFNNNC